MHILEHGVSRFQHTCLMGPGPILSSLHLFQPYYYQLFRHREETMISQKPGGHCLIISNFFPSKAFGLSRRKW